MRRGAAVGWGLPAYSCVLFSIHLYYYYNKLPIQLGRSGGSSRRLVVVRKAATQRAAARQRRMMMSAAARLLLAVRGRLLAPPPLSASSAELSEGRATTREQLLSCRERTYCVR